MLDKIIPIKLIYFLDLIRFSKPIGFMLLMWPCWFALTLIPLPLDKLFKWYVLFFIGAFCMRSAGCIINDLIDMKIDRNINRTSNRPLAAKKLLITEALILLSIMLFLSLVILLQFNYKAIIVGLFSFPLIILYPFVKRYSHWPQVILGIAFSWGIIIVAYQFQNTLTLNHLILYIGCIFWTLGYDTIYAYQDRDDDIRNNIKSTAVLFGNKGIWFVKFFYLMFFLTIAYLSFKTDTNSFSLIVIIIFIFVMNLILNKWEPTSRKSSDYYFKFNNLVGLCCFLFLLIF